MRFMVFVKANRDTEAGVLPTTELLTQMGKFNEELVKAGVMLAGEGLQPSAKGARVKFSGSDRTVQNGPFNETRQLVAGFWLWNCPSLAEAIRWARRCPNPTGSEGELEIRQLYEMTDLGPQLTPELEEQDRQLRAQIGAKGEPAPSVH
jgi:hypothetical protein